MPRVGWAAYDADFAARTLACVREILELGGRAEFGAAIERAEREIRENGISLTIAAEWSAAVLVQATYEPKAVTGERFEIALRIALTGLEEPFTRALNFDPRSVGYEQLSNVFLSRGDLVSARTATEIALDALAGEGNLDGIRASAKRRLEERLKRLREED
jgi:hypothetical protein